MTRRGKILRDTNVGPGLLVVDDTQLAFTLERMWRSTIPPAPGMVVDVEVSGSTVVSVTAVPEGQLAREQAGRAFNSARHHGTALAHRAAARFGFPTLVAGATLTIGWFFPAVASLTTPLGRIDFTFWQVLGAMNSGGDGMARRMAGLSSSTGVYGILAVIALAGPFIRPLWKDRRAYLAGILPLLLMLVAAWKLWHLGTPSGSDTAASLDAANADLVRSIATGVQDEIRGGISIGFGAYTSGVAAAYLAFVSARRYLAAAAALV